MLEVDLRGFNYLPEGLQHQVLRSLVDKPLATETIWEQIKQVNKRLLSIPDFVTDCLSVLVQEGHLSYLDNGSWQLTTNGLGMINFLGSKSRRVTVDKLSVATNHSVKPNRDKYQGEELKATVMRKGAYDFLALPSRYGDEYIMHPTAHLSKEHSND